jgi:hypothetical protein
LVVVVGFGFGFEDHHLDVRDVPRAVLVSTARQTR